MGTFTGRNLPNRAIWADASGFTLVEMMVSAGLTLLVSLAVAASLSNTYRQYLSAQGATIAVEDLSVLTGILTTQLQNLGGGPVRSWHSVWVENNCGPRGPLSDCQGSDRLTLILVPTPIQNCAITGQPSPGTVSVSTSPTCCLNAGMVNQPAMFVTGSTFAQKFITGVDLAACTASYVPGQAAGNDSAPGAYVWSSGAMVISQVITYYLDVTKKELHSYSDLNGNGTIDPGEDKIIADHVYDLQAALGYDVNPADGIITDRGSTTDEVLYNAPGESMGAGVFSLVLPVNLYSVLVAITSAGVSASSSPIAQTAQSFDGPMRTAPVDLKVQKFQVVPRNNYFY